MEAIRNSACATGPSATEEKEIEEKVRERRIDQEKKNEKSDATNPEKKRREVEEGDEERPGARAYYCYYWGALDKRRAASLPAKFPNFLRSRRSLPLPRIVPSPFLSPTPPLTLTLVIVFLFLFPSLSAALQGPSPRSPSVAASDGKVKGGAIYPLKKKRRKK